jgi:6-pyruvoyltetrahydropterin/6-carboxytetrahydropterin synthase
MDSVTVIVGWCMGHRLPNHTGKCFNLHGHQYTVEVTVRGKIDDRVGSSSEGMVVDFTDVKNQVRSIVADLDHRFLVSAADPFLGVGQNPDLPGVILVPWIPTAENIATRMFLDRIPEATRVKLWETPTSFAEVTR